MRQSNLCCIVNLPARKERLCHILQLFGSRKEFVFKVFTPLPAASGSLSLWITIKRIIASVDPSLDYFILCEDDHEFTSSYSFDLLEKCIDEAQQLDADILLGGVSWFKTGIQVSKHLFWIEKFSGLQFTVVFKKFYQTILHASFTDFDEADYKISDLTGKKFIIYPFISVQKDFGYSDVTRRNHDERRVERLFEEASERFSLLQKVTASFSKNEFLNLPAENEISQIRLPLFTITKEIKLKNFFTLKCLGFSCAAIHILNNHYLEQWEGLCECINIAQKNEEDFIIITFDSFVLKKDFKQFFLVSNVIKANMHNCDMLMGDMGKFNHAVPVNESLFWVDSFSHSSFVVLFAGVYEKIRSIRPEPDEVNIYNYLSYVTSNKMAVYPFLSEPEDLNNGYESDIKFQEKGDQLAIYQTIARKFTLKESL